MNRVAIRIWIQYALLLLLIPTFFILHGYNENFGLIPLDVLVSLFLQYGLISLTVFLVASVLYKNKLKAFSFSVFILLIFFFFGAIHDQLKFWLPATLIISYKFLLPFLFILTILLFLWLRKNINEGLHIVRFLRLLLILFIVWEVFILCFHILTNKNHNNLAIEPGIYKNVKDTCTNLQKPDIYFVVLDGYTSSKCLKKDFNYNNYEIDSLLTSFGYYIAYDSKSNYNVTPFSLSSTFESNYLEHQIDNEVISSKMFLKATETFKNNTLTAFLKKEGYIIKNFGLFDLKEASPDKRTYFDNAVNQIDNQTLSSRIKRDIGWNFTIKNIITGKFKIPRSYYAAKEYHINRNLYNWSQLLKEIQVTANKPRFVYTHLMLPHEPFYFNRDGTYVSDTSILLNSLDLKESYLNQLIYTNSLLKQLIPLATIKGEREKVIIIQGDHGFRDFEGPNAREKEFYNLNTYYFSDTNYTGLYPKISPVNTFRVILNKYFCQTLPILKDESIYLINKN